MDFNDKKRFISTSALLAPLLFLLNEQIAEEIVFPANVAYSVLTFYMTYSESHVLRHYLASFFLSFCEIFYISVLKVLYRKGSRGVDPFKSDFLVLFIEFSIVFIAIRIMSKKEIYLEFRDSGLRNCVFLLKGFFKARALVISLRIMTGSNAIQITQSQFVAGILSSGIIAALPAVVYLVDTFLWSEVSVVNIDLNGVFELGKYAISLSAFALTVEVFVPPRLEILIGSSVSSLFIYSFYLIYYSYDSYKYSQFFTVKPNAED